MKPFYCRIGSKRPVAATILAHFPAEHKTYVEPFCGSAAIFFAKEPSEIEALNDLDAGLMFDYSLLVNAPAVTHREHFAGLDALRAYVTSEDAHPLTRAIILRNNKFNGMAECRQIYKTTDPWAKLQHLERYRERLRGVVLHCKSYLDLLAQYDAPDTFFFMDPPYEGSTGLYKHAAFDYEELAARCRTLQGRFMITLNDSPRIRELFADYRFVEYTTGHGGGRRVVGGRRRNELMIMNY